MDETLNNSFREQNQQVDQDLDERESEMAAERENEENEVTQDQPQIEYEECSCTRLIVDRRTPPRCTVERIVMSQFFPKPQLGCFIAAFVCTEMAQKN